MASTGGRALPCLCSTTLAGLGPDTGLRFSAAMNAGKAGPPTTARPTFGRECVALGPGGGSVGDADNGGLPKAPKDAR